MSENRSRVVQRRYRALVESGADPREWPYAWHAELNRGGFRTVDFLMDEVVGAGKCVGCAACVTICPTDVFDYADERPVAARGQACVQCVLCADVCPVLRPADASLPEALDYRDPRQDHGYGRYSYELLSRSTCPDVQARAQDGGVVSALLLQAMETGTIRGVVLGDVAPSDPQLGRHRLATNAAEILACRGSRYTYSPNTLALTEARERDIRPLAVVGVPCQVDGVRQQQHSGVRLAINRWYQANVRLVVGLFCSESFTHEAIEAIGQRFEVRRSEIENINIKGKVVVRLKGGRIETMSLKQFRQYARSACWYCLDYAAEHADISVGGIGLDGWSYTVIRTEAGHDAFQAAVAGGRLESRPVADAPKSRPLLIRMAKGKRERPLPALAPGLAETGPDAEPL